MVFFIRLLFEIKLNSNEFTHYNAFNSDDICLTSKLEIFVRDFAKINIALPKYNMYTDATCLLLLLE